MLTNKSVFFFLITVFISSVSYSQEQGIKSIVQNDLQRHLAFIAYDSLQGRHFGTKAPGLEIASLYIQQNIEEYGVKPGPDGYFQQTDIVSVEADVKNSFLKLADENDKVIFQTKDITTLHQNLCDVAVSGELVFGGFGSDAGRSVNYNEPDIKGKVVVYCQGSAATFNKGKIQEWDCRIEAGKIDRAFKAGAKAVIIFTTPGDKKEHIFSQKKQKADRMRYSLKSDIKNSNPGLVFITTSKVAEKLLNVKGRLKKQLTDLSKGKEFRLEQNQALAIDVQIKKTSKFLGGRNVVGVVEGSDPVLKNEYVIYVAHYDHLGVAENGDVYNGADDNGTGTVALIEMAKAFQQLEEKPKRSIIFLWVTGEEIGMFGSRYYVNYPLFPLEKTVACINIDMIGRVYEPSDSVWKDSPKLVKDKDGVYTLISDFCPELVQVSDAACEKLNLVPDKTLPQSFIRRSDQINFHNKEIPILNVATGYHADYHKVTDEVSRINFDKLKRVTDFCFLAGYEIANRKEPLKIVKKEQ